MINIEFKLYIFFFLYAVLNVFLTFRLYCEVYVSEIEADSTHLAIDVVFFEFYHLSIVSSGYTGMIAIGKR